MNVYARLALLAPLVFLACGAHAADQGQFENVPDNIRSWFKSVKSPKGVPAATFPTVTAPITICARARTGCRSKASGGRSLRGR